MRDASTILRLSWFPLLIVTIVQYFAVRAQFAAMRSALESGNVGALTTFFPMWRWQLANILTALVGSTIVAVALHRVILFGDRKPGRFVHLAFGKVELLFGALPVMIMIPVVIVSMLIAGLAVSTLPRGTGGIVAFILLLLWWAAVTFAAFRLELVLPITVLEGRYNFRQAWALTRGNFWRVVALWLVVLIPLAIVAGGVAALTSPFGALSQGAPKDVSAIFERAGPLLLVQSIVGYVWSIIGGALSVAVLSYSYKALSGIDPDAVWTPETPTGP